MKFILILITLLLIGQSVFANSPLQIVCSGEEETLTYEFTKHWRMAVTAKKNGQAVMVKKLKPNRLVEREIHKFLINGGTANPETVIVYGPYYEDLKEGKVIIGVSQDEVVELTCETTD